MHQRFKIEIPEIALVLLMGLSGSGKSAFAARHFAEDEVLDGAIFTKYLGCQDALDSLLYVAAKRLKQGKLTVIDFELVKPSVRRIIIDLARSNEVMAVAIALDMPKPMLLAKKRAEISPEQISEQFSLFRRSLGGLEKEGFGRAYVLYPEACASAEIVRTLLPPNKKCITGAFDIIGDLHGCLPELRELLQKLGYEVSSLSAAHPRGRKVIFVGDLADRGPDSAGALGFVMKMVEEGSAMAVIGNHDEKLRRALDGKSVKMSHGLSETLEQLSACGEQFKQEVKQFIGSLPSHLVLDKGNLVIAHAGMPEHFQGRDSKKVTEFALYGDVDGTKDEFGMPVRRDWAKDYAGGALVVYGHTPQVSVEFINNTVNVDTGCVFGGSLSALCYPEMTTVSVGAHLQYEVPKRPLEDRRETSVKA